MKEICCLQKTNFQSKKKKFYNADKLYSKRNQSFKDNSSVYKKEKIIQ